MAEVTYFVALPFVAADDGIAAGEPTELDTFSVKCCELSDRSHAVLSRLNRKPFAVETS
jgi:hypothetical protein